MNSHQNIKKRWMSPIFVLEIQNAIYPPLLRYCGRCSLARPISCTCAAGQRFHPILNDRTEFQDMALSRLPLL